MRTAFVVLALATLAYFFVVQKRSERTAVVAPPNAARVISEHDWAKHALDTTAKVKRDVLQQRAADGSR